MEKQPKINNEELYQKHRKSGEEIKKARERYDEIIRENQEAGNIELHPEILKEATSLYQEWGKEQLAKALEKQDFQRAKKIIIELEERQRTVEKSETPKGRFFKNEIIKEGKLVGFLGKKFDDKGKMIEEVEKDSEGKLIGSRKYKYNDKGKMIEEVRKYLRGEFIWFREKKYDDKGKMMEEVEKDSKN